MVPTGDLLEQDDLLNAEAIALLRFETHTQGSYGWEPMDDSDLIVGEEEGDDDA